MSDAFSDGPTSDSLAYGQTKTPLVAKTDKPRKKWGAIEAVLFSIFLYLGLQLLAAFVVLPIASLTGGKADQLDVWLESIHNQLLFFGVWVIMAATALWLFLKKRHANLRDVGIDTPRLQYIAYGFGGVIVYFAVYFVAVMAISQLIPSLDLQQEQDLGFEAPRQAAEYLSAFVTLVVLPPIIEELIFRGFLFKGMRATFTFLPAAIFTSVLFALGHLEFGNGTPLLWIAGIDTFILSMVMCYVRERTGSIWPTILMHALKNMVAFTFLYLVVK